MSEFNISIEGGTSYRLHTAGKFCDRDIVVTAEGSGGYTYEGSADTVPEGFFRNDQHLIGFHLRHANEISVYKNAFRECPVLKSVQVKGSAWLYNYAFAQCPELEFVKGNILYVAQSAFEECYALKQIDGDVTFLKDQSGIEPTRAFANCRSLESIRLRCFIDGLYTYIFSQMFLNCENLTDVAFVGGLEGPLVICETAFSGCSKLYKIDIPECKKIESDAFGGCTNLHAIVLRSTTKVCEVALDALNDTPMLTGAGHVYVPTAMYEYYRAGYEETLNTLMPGFFDILFRKIEDYPEICGTT
jgi:hypothetical protein